MNKLKIKEYEDIASFLKNLTHGGDISKDLMLKYLQTNQIKRANRFFILNHEELGIIGCIMLRDDINSLYIEALFIKNEFQKLGFGKAIVNTFIDVYREKGYKNIKLESERDSYLFWKKQGFTGAIDNMEYIL